MFALGGWEEEGEEVEEEVVVVGGVSAVVEAAEAWAAVENVDDDIDEMGRIRTPSSAFFELRLRIELADDDKCLAVTLVGFAKAVVLERSNRREKGALVVVIFVAVVDAAAAAAAGDDDVVETVVIAALI